jgi:hypothetical protein
LILSMGFIETSERVKTAIDNASSNNDLRTILKPVLEAANRLGNRLAGYVPGAFTYINPLRVFKEFWAPQDELARQEYDMLATASQELSSFIDSLPVDEAGGVQKEPAKLAVVKLLGTISALESMPGLSSNQWNQAIDAFSTDALNAVPLFMKGVLIVTDTVLDHVIKPIADGTATGVWHILKRIIFSLWWLLIILAIVFTLPYTIPFITTALIGTAAAHA